MESLSLEDLQLSACPRLHSRELLKVEMFVMSLGLKGNKLGRKASDSSILVNCGSKDQLDIRGGNRSTQETLTIMTIVTRSGFSCSRLRCPKGGILRFLKLLILASLTLSGCVITDLTVSNPIPEMSRVAIVPFVNLSSERAVDGRHFAEIYFSELQKCPGFQVLPIGITETAIREHNLNLERPAEVLELARILDVDAVVFGAVTEYSPYKPPRIGLQTSWYTAGNYHFFPGIPVDPSLRELENDNYLHHMLHKAKFWKDGGHGHCRKCRELRPDGHPEECQCQACQMAGKCSSCSQAAIRGQSPELIEEGWANGVPTPLGGPTLPGGPRPLEYSVEPQPVMSYTRIFDSSDPDMVAMMRDYVELNGELRSGGVKGWTQRSDDYIRFCMHRMILEMFQLHGGESKRRFFVTTRRYR